VDNPQNIISFCTGYGGIELGLRRAGVDVRVVCNVEIEAFVQANLVAKIEEGRMDDAPIWTDLKTFPASIFRGKIHGLIGGYPCQPFSSAGKRKGEEDPRHLWPYIRKHIRAIRPVWCFFENVRGHTTMGLWRVLSDLEEDGYRTEYGLFSAEETGAPHQRIRCFILARLGNSDVRYEGSHGIECGVLPTQTEDRQASGLKRASDTRQVGNPASERPHRGRENCEGEQSEVLGERLESDEELADSVGGRFEQRESECEKEDFVGKGGQTQWPARPGEEQYEWEEPRVTEAQSELGGAVDGSACGVDSITNRVDRLRLLGNGVVSQCAELAWRTLWRKLNK